MQAGEIRRYSVEEYFILDEAAPEGVRLEYDEGALFCNGQVYDPEWGWEAARDLAGARPEHNRIVSNLSYVLMTQLRERGCDVLTSDQRAAIASHKYTYPDVVVACEPSYDGMQLTNPELIVEVLSPSTAERDLSDKLHQYRAVSSLQEYWAVQVSRIRVTRYYRRADGWGVESYGDLEDTIRSDRLAVEVPLKEIYRGL